MPITPPKVLAAKNKSVGTLDKSGSALAASTCRVANNAFDELSDPVIAVPIQPIIGERNANKSPVLASALPIELVWPEKFMT